LLLGADSAAADYRAPADYESGKEDLRRLEDVASEAPIVRLVHDLIGRAVGMQASDIHLEPRDEGLCVRVRIEGVLHILKTYPAALRFRLPRAP
jgi:general secretion pathway protein E